MKKFIKLSTALFVTVLLVVNSIFCFALQSTEEKIIDIENDTEAIRKYTFESRGLLYELNDSIYIILIIVIILLLLLISILIVYITEAGRLKKQISELKNLLSKQLFTDTNTNVETQEPNEQAANNIVVEAPPKSNKKCKKRNYYYTDKGQTPLTWHNWFIFTLIIGALTSFGSLFTSFSNYNYLCEIINDLELISTLEVITGFECICNIAWAILCIFTVIGLSKFKTSGWICLIAAFITRPVLNLVIGCMWMSFDLSLGITPLISAFVIALSDIPIYIYYNKRKPLFFPEMIDSIADEQKVKYLEITHKDPKQLYKSDNLNKTIPLSDDE